MKSLGRWNRWILLPAIALVAIQPALASYIYPLSSEAIREAYFLGKRNDEQTAAFFVKYVHSLPQPKSGPQVGVIGIDTPYSAIVRHVQHTPNDGYDAQEAEQEFLGKPGTFGVYVEIFFTTTYPDPSQMSPHGTNNLVTPAFWEDFKVRVTQDREIEARSTKGGPIYTDYAQGDHYGLIGAEVGGEVDLDYDPAKIDAASPLTVEVLTPDGQDVQTTFDLSQLR